MQIITLFKISKVLGQICTKLLLKGAGGGVPWGQIMENEFEYLVDRGGHRWAFS